MLQTGRAIIRRIFSAELLLRRSPGLAKSRRRDTLEQACPSPPGGLDYPLHYIVLPLFGMPWGEFWRLDRLAEHCGHTGEYDFLFVSAPLNVPGGVGSPPQAIAIT